MARIVPFFSRLQLTDLKLTDHPSSNKSTSAQSTPGNLSDPPICASKGPWRRLRCQGSCCVPESWVNDLNVSPDNIKLEGNTGKNHVDTGLANDFLDMTPKHEEQKKKWTDRTTSNSKASAWQKKQENEKTTYRIRGSFCKLYIR